MRASVAAAHGAQVGQHVADAVAGVGDPGRQGDRLAGRAASPDWRPASVERRRRREVGLHARRSGPRRAASSGPSVRCPSRRAAGRCSRRSGSGSSPAGAESKAARLHAVVLGQVELHAQRIGRAAEAAPRARGCSTRSASLRHPGGWMSGCCRRRPPVAAGRQVPELPAGAGRVPARGNRRSRWPSTSWSGRSRAAARGRS